MEALKKCSKCKKQKYLTDFNKQKSAKDGKRPYCKECASLMFKDWLQKNKEYNLIRVKQFIKNNPDKRKIYNTKYSIKNERRIKDYNRNYYKENKDKIKTKSNEYSKNNVEKVKNYRKLWNLKNKEYKNNTDRIYSKKYREDNKDLVKKANKIWRENNPEKNNAKAAKYRASKMRATPKWLTELQLFEIIDIYRQARELSSIFFNRKFHVDHILPLKGKEVCGLHVPWNLQILTSQENTRKNNKF